jgi:NAD-dependent SIR2 family protein deacetylase
MGRYIVNVKGRMQTVEVECLKCGQVFKEDMRISGNPGKLYGVCKECKR